MLVWEYREYTISHDVLDNKYFITYPNETEACIYTASLEKAKEFIDGMWM